MASEAPPGAATTTYEPAAYWVDRHSQLKGDIRSVGNRGVSVEENEKGYVRRGAILRELLAELGLAEGSSLIEFGCGIGMQAPVIVGAGLEYTGVDISPDALTAAKQRCPEGSFIQADIRNFRTFSTRYDVALAGYVLCHMVADADWTALLSSVTASIRPGGHVIIEEQIPAEDPIRHGDYVLARPFGDYAGAFRGLGLTLIERLCSTTLLVAVRSGGKPS